MDPIIHCQHCRTTIPIGEAKKYPFCLFCQNRHTLPKEKTKFCLTCTLNLKYCSCPPKK